MARHRAEGPADGGPAEPAPGPLERLLLRPVPAPRASARRARAAQPVDGEVDELADPPFRPIGVDGSPAAAPARLGVPGLAAPSLSTGPIAAPVTRRALRERRARGEG